jgi:GTP cyclohydrolase II
LVTLSYAQSLDGSIAARRGSPLALSGSKSLVLTHKLRAAHDAILVGIGTVLADKPCLNTRLVKGKSPQPVVLDSHLRFPLDVDLLRNRQLPLWLATTERAARERQKILEAAGARVLRVPSDANGQIDLNILLELLADFGINSLMVEGGARVITSFLSKRLVDQLVLTISPLLIGGLRAVEDLLLLDGEEGLDAAHFLRVRILGYEELGTDLVVWGTLA